MEGRALTLSLAASLGLHALLWLGSAVVPFVHLSAHVPIEVVPFKKHPPLPPVATPGGTSSHATHVAKPGNGSRPAFAPPADDLRQVGPPGANLTLILRTTLLRKSPHRAGVDQLLSLLPDYHTLLDGTTLNLFDNLDAILIATPDPRDVAATFLAARHAPDPRIDQIVTHKLGDGDPRTFRALGPELMVLGPPEVVTTLDAEGPWSTALPTFDATNPDAALQVTIADLAQLIRFQGPLPLPHQVKLSMTADASPRVRLVCEFDDEDRAQTFFALWPTIQRQIGELAPPFSGALDALPATRHGTIVELVGTLPERQLTTAFSFARLLPSATP